MEVDGEVIDAALFPVQPWIDVPDLGFAVLVCADDQAVATAAAERLADMAWERRADFFPDAGFPAFDANNTLYVNGASTLTLSIDP